MAVSGGVDITFRLVWECLGEGMILSWDVNNEEWVTWEVQGQRILAERGAPVKPWGKNGSGRFEE